MLCLVCNQTISNTTTWNMLFSLSRSQHKSPLCTECTQQLEEISGEQCRLCSRPFSKLAAKYRKGDLCNDCFIWEEQPEWSGLLERNLSIFHYNEFLKEVLARFKFRGDHELVNIFASYMRQKFKQISDRKNTPIIIPVPLSPERLYERGFNQAYSLASLLHFPIDDILERVHTEKQSKKKRTERVLADSPFSLRHNIQRDRYANKQLLLIDDIYTTGTTLRQISKVLKPLSPKSICALTLARG